MTQQYEAGDRRPIGQRSWFLVIAAAYLELANPQSAAAVLETHFKPSGIRQQFARAFKIVDEHLRPDA
jgi:hypothetical protein